MLSNKTIVTHIPGAADIELAAYYPQFEWYYPNCEPQTKRWFVENAQSDWTFFDCGANIGYFSILFSRLAPRGKVFAFEPTETARLLEKNLAHLRIANVRVMELALGNKSGRVVDDVYRIWGDAAERREYPFTTIDDFVKAEGLKSVDCIKIDVDSFDFEVLQGARNTLLTQNPYVVVELNHALSRRNQANTQALAWLAELGYSNALVLDDDNFILKRGAEFPGGHSILLQFPKPAAGPKAVHMPVVQTPAQDTGGEVGIVDVEDLKNLLGFKEAINYPASSRTRPLLQWEGERDDGPILRYIFRNFLPRRHLEFGTWYGDGVMRCVEECAATVWTINLPDGENKPDGNWAYATDQPQAGAIPEGITKKTVELPDHTSRTFYRTDSGGFIGVKYREKGMSHRVAQILCDSRRWDTSAYPAGFFDTAFIDGGHQFDVVKNDTIKALSLVRSGGLILWHDFVLDEQALAQCASPREIVAFIKQEKQALMEHLAELVWIRPSWLLMGIRK